MFQQVLAKNNKQEQQFQPRASAVIPPTKSQEDEGLVQPSQQTHKRGVSETEYLLS